MQRVTLLAALAISALLPTAARAQFDKIYPPQGIPVQGNITKMSQTEVTLETNGVERSFPVNEITRIAFGDDPAELASARDDIRRGQVEQSLTALKGIDRNTIPRAVVRQDLDYYIAVATAKLAMAGSEDKAGAVRMLMAFRDANPQNFHYFETTELIGDLAVALGNYDAAADFYRQLGAAPWPEYKLRSNVLTAQALQSAGKYAEALTGYQAVIGSPLSNPAAQRQKMLAQVGAAVCMAETGKADQAVKVVEDIIQKNDPSDTPLFARAYNALGACYRAGGKTKEARLAYLHTHILFYGDSEAHAEALLHLTKLAEELNKAQDAVKMRTLLKERYGGSVWEKRL